MLEHLTQVDVHEQIREQLKAYIASTGLQPGDRLPSEHQLVKTLGVSRNALREAFRSLEALGMIEARHGKGRFLRHFDFDLLTDNLAFSLVLDRTSMSELLSVRRVLEVGFLPEAIRALTDDDLARLNEIVATMRAKTRGGETYSAEDAAFHQTLFHRVDNELLAKLLAIFWRLLRSVDKSGVLPPARSSHIVEYHADIVAAIERGEVTEAQRLLDEHFDDLAERIRQATG